MTTVRITFFGDIVGKIGRKAVGDYLSGLPTDFSIANVENASHGFGQSEKNYNELSGYGINCFTAGNHIWDKKEIFNYIDGADKLVRPANYPEATQGVGSRVFELNGCKIAVINLLGQVFMNPIRSPFEVVEAEIKKLKEITPIIFVDFHAEASAEKLCFGRFCASLGVSAVVGTHTHVQTSDERIINEISTKQGKTAYITDVGFCGAYNSIIGMDFETSLKRFTTCLPQRYEIAEDNLAQINAVEIEIDTNTGAAVSIKRISCTLDYNKKEV